MKRREKKKDWAQEENEAQTPDKVSTHLAGGEAETEGTNLLYDFNVTCSPSTLFTFP